MTFYRAGGTQCPECGAHVAVRLGPGELCPQCESTRAWEQYGKPGERLVIGHRDIAEAKARFEGEKPKISANAPPWLFGLIAIGLALAGAFFAWDLFRARPLGPLASIQVDLLHDSHWSTAFGIVALFLGIGALVIQRTGILFRSAPLLLVNLTAILLGTIGAVIGATNWVGMSGFNWSHRSMPPFPDGGDFSELERAIARATVVLVAPDADGDARGASIGSGAVIRSTRDEAFLVTCSHVAMPYASPSAFRDPADALPVWVYFSDGRNAAGKVVWTAEPPLDVAVVRVGIDNPPLPVPVETRADSADPGFAVAFVPNPFRAGWMVHRGSVMKRESHRTPAGVYSLIYTSLPVQPGDSGTGLFDSLGRLIGLNTWTQFEDGGPKGISLPSNTMERIMSVMDGGELVSLDEPEGASR